MDVFAKYLSEIDNVKHRARTEEVLTWVAERFQNLMPKIAWNQPMFTDYDTFIIGFSIAKQHLAVAPEKVGIDHFSDEIVKDRYGHTKQTVQLFGGSEFYNMIEKEATEKSFRDASLLLFWCADNKYVTFCMTCNCFCA